MTPVNPVQEQHNCTASRFASEQFILKWHTVNGFAMIIAEKQQFEMSNQMGLIFCLCNVMSNC